MHCGSDHCERAYSGIDIFVVDAETGASICDATIHVEAANGAEHETLYGSDINCRYGSIPVFYGEHRITAERQGYVQSAPVVASTAPVDCRTVITTATVFLTRQ